MGTGRPLLVPSHAAAARQAGDDLCSSGAEGRSDYAHLEGGLVTSLRRDTDNERSPGRLTWAFIVSKGGLEPPRPFGH
jgi:hypothetical protein